MRSEKQICSYNGTEALIYRDVTFNKRIQGATSRQIRQENPEVKFYNDVF